MWVPKVIAEEESGFVPYFASVVYSDKKSVAVSGSESVENIGAVCPYGIAYMPPKGSRAVVLPVGNTAVLCGVAEQSPRDLDEGEIGLYSSGGASIVLKNDGSVLINGKIFGSEG